MLTLYRYYSIHGTVGYIPDLDLWTIERPWQNNQSGVSCVPEGVYTLERHEPTSVSLPPGYSHTYALVNHELGVSHYHDPACKRSVCLFGHIANYPEEVQGCIGFGKNHIIHDNRLIITRSTEATKEMLDYIEHGGIKQIEIAGYRP